MPYFVVTALIPCGPGQTPADLNSEISKVMPVSGYYTADHIDAEPDSGSVHKVFELQALAQMRAVRDNGLPVYKGTPNE